MINFATRNEEQNISNPLINSSINNTNNVSSNNNNYNNLPLYNNLNLNDFPPNSPLIINSNNTF